ncbi:hypothetical protein [uncultured Paludibaculum sp.]|uniref:hypothetical protein n=1 Tax=uncultured Paludibaculum sp. TaxID=1765020 RepID=UPI002AAACC51|nr:hypothetical protein [uncultured Paludibaculum sp.]
MANKDKNKPVAEAAVIDAQPVEASTAVAVVEQGETGLMTADQQAAMIAQMMADDAGVGFENVTAADVAIPYLKLLQKGSPQCEEGNQAFMDAAKAGMLLNNVTNGLVDIRTTAQKFAVVVPVSYIKVISVWRPNQGGKVCDLPMNQATLDAATRKDTPDGGIILVNEEGNILEETAKFNVLLLTADGGVHWGIMALSGSKLGAAKKWMSLVTSKKMPNSTKQAPIFSFMYKVASYLETSKRTGKTYQQLRFEDFGKITDPTMYVAAKEYRQAVLTGTVKEAVNDVAPDASADTGTGDDVPF